MAQVMRIEDNFREDVVVLSKKEYEQMKSEIRRDKAKIKFYQEMQQPLRELVEGKTRTVSQVMKRLKEQKYE
ncbi:hypothetical protein SAMN02745116_01722 [Pilibacter termitis]|uniref:Uncharacterized protein n=1 Tax=Pilibacter termitis TaxID=263852 RepID=A0A1T4PAI6_9ENTE|nr:hypothetical protein [Pilibacter termitis]SJZ88357.1 hypothetical protein SAMN02745116_01722 [Pilibacter termitis]